MSFKFGLNVKSKGANPLAKSGAKPGLGKKKKPLFDEEEEDVKDKAKAADGVQEIGELNLEDALAPKSSEPSKPAPKQKKGQPPAPPTKKPKAKEDDPTNVAYSASAAEAEKRAQEALEGDATLYDYDAAYDALHAQKVAKAAAAREDAAEQKPKYMDAMFESAEQRKKDLLRARDKLLQREREAEGDEFADKEKFVTGAYKAQQEETRKAEEEEKKRQEAEEERKKKFGMQSFHKKMLAEQEQQHQEAMEAAARALKEGIKPPVVEEEKEKTEAELVAELRKQGKNVALNEEGQVTDKRQLLSAGLNIIAKPKPAATASSATAAPKYVPPTHTANKGGRSAQRERQTAMVAEQIEAANKRKADEEAEEQAKLEHTRKSQKTEKDISSAKERYLQRKKEAAAAKAAAGK
ncbi:coiled-coil domain-containing protein 55 [Stemphylium lycopersici]|uniref:Coiled-coil domain-containing protein 55 n=1 Tax=Stemphylium lycopersici TaxID=183478 RepID=A0A364MUD4_STELY|nr:coiled-coil domain-containing protein 55 [Stemphylium lycopersici]RAQ99759.1 coiled-coil domain-containing protein 55 [Stemphylium lycopersici]RAR03773.1 coiled-coil domain-containing protein 55 [Stemphylium lycopersici]